MKTFLHVSTHSLNIRLLRHDGLDTGECNMSVLGVVELAINKQTLVLESEPISIPSATFNRPARVIVSEHRCNI